MIRLGWEGEDLTVVLTRDSDFFPTLIGPEPWPAGTEITIRLTGGAGGEVIWPATVDGVRASWFIPAIDVNAVIADGATHARLMYRGQQLQSTGFANPVVQVQWASGAVHDD